MIVRRVKLQKKVMSSFEHVWNNYIFPGRFSKAEYKFLLLLFVTAWCTNMALQLGDSDVEYYKYYMRMQVFCEVTPCRLRRIAMTVWLWRLWHYGKSKLRWPFFNIDDDEHIGQNMYYILAAFFCLCIFHIIYYSLIHILLYIYIYIYIYIYMS